MAREWPVRLLILPSTTDGGPATTVDNKGYTTMLPAGSYTLTAAFTPTVPADFNNLTSGQISTTVQLTVNQATPKITWANPKAIIYGTALSSTQLDPTVSTLMPGTTTAVPGTFSFTATPKTGITTAVDSTGFTTVLPAGSLYAHRYLHADRHNELHGVGNRRQSDYGEQENAGDYLEHTGGHRLRNPAQQYAVERECL